MDSGCGNLGHHALHHVDQELGLEQLIHAQDNFMLGWHALEVEQTLKAAKVYFQFQKACFLFVNKFMFLVEGTWVSWGPWNNCSATCGQGTQSRSRNFTGGMPCTGNATEIRPCQGELTM